MQLWMFSPSTDMQAMTMLHSVGIKTVVASHQALHTLIDQSFATYATVHAFPATGGDTEVTIDIYGHSFEWFSSGCPNSPAIRDRFYHQLEQILSDRVKGVFLDGVRFPSPASCLVKSNFFSCFCPHCQEDMTARGYDRKAIMNDVRKATDLMLSGSSAILQRWLRALYSPSGWLTLQAAYPGLLAWFRYRADCITSFIQELSGWMSRHYPEKELAAFLFQPCLAYLVGQDYRRLSPYLDIVSPMIYRNYPHQPGPATINQEIMAIATLLRENTNLPLAQCLEDLLCIFGLEIEGELAQGSKGLISMPINHVAEETLAAAALSSPRSKVVPIIWAGDERLPEAITSLREIGVEHCILFSYEAGAAAHEDYFPEILADGVRP
ncbi:MAG: hypothetical protein GX998_00400 [Firmicutes bacterium]|nr:hypothetical protein [Bacillota bacterium]